MDGRHTPPAVQEILSSPNGRWCLIAEHHITGTGRPSRGGPGGASAGLLFAVGLLLGLSSSPMIAYYANGDPAVLWQAGGATALFIAGCGAVGYATRRDLSALGRVSSRALVALIIFGVVMIFVNIPTWTPRR
jgi:Inhibitor of apoptosis-promoting Bax1